MNTLIGGIPFGVLIFIVVWRKRNLAPLIFYYELIYLIFHGFVPYNYGDVLNWMILYSSYITYLAFGCGKMGTLIAMLTLTFSIQTLVQYPLLYSEDYGFGMIVGKLY